MANDGKINVFVRGSGRAALAIRRALAIVSINDPKIELGDLHLVKRGEKLSRPDPKQRSLLIIANPHGLHADSILEGVAAGFEKIIVEKPAAVTLDEVQKLRAVEQHPIAVCHGYRQSWAIQSLARLAREGKLGELFSIEGRYWQSSAAQRAIQKVAPSVSWKNDPSLSGAFDVFLDLGTHWADLVTFLVGQLPSSVKSRRSFVNSEAPHRDTHLWLDMDFPGGILSRGSVSKNTHGHNNHLEINLFGSEGSAQWTFARPDEILMGVGSEQKTLVRPDATMGSQQAPFHGMGWLEGYIEILRGLLNPNASEHSYPRLKDSLDLLELLLKSA